MLGLNFRESCRGKFKESKLLTVTAIYIQECIIFFHKNKHLFRNSFPQSAYPIREINYVYPKHRLTLTEKGAYYNCIKFFNYLPINIKTINNTKMLKKKIFNLLVTKEPYNVSEYFETVRQINL